MLLIRQRPLPLFPEVRRQWRLVLLRIFACQYLRLLCPWVQCHYFFTHDCASYLLCTSDIPARWPGQGCPGYKIQGKRPSCLPANLIFSPVVFLYILPFSYLRQLLPYQAHVIIQSLRYCKLLGLKEANSMYLYLSRAAIAGKHNAIY